MNNKWNIREYLVPILIVAAGSALFVTVPILAWKGMMPSDLFIEVLSVVVSWPVAVTIVGLLFLTRYREPLDYFLRNIGSVKLPGGVEIQSSAHQTQDSSSAASDGSITLSYEQQQQVSNLVQELDTQTQLSIAEKEKLKNQLRNSLVQSVHWRLQYLNLLFVPVTKQVLY